MHEDFAAIVFAHVLPEKNLREIPKISWEMHPKHPRLMRIFLVSQCRSGLAKFFFDMVTRWLIPGKQLDPVLYFFTHYEGYAVAELDLQLVTEQDLSWAKDNISFLQREILMGVDSFFHAKKILEMKGLTLDEKASFVQDKISALLKRFPTYFDYDIFEEMQHLLITTKEEFKAVRRSAEIGRIIFTLYLFRKSLEKKIVKNRVRRHLCLKFKKTLLHMPFGLKEVLSVFVGVNFVKEHEIFEERHLLSALRRFVPGVCNVPGSYVSFGGDKIHRFYLEIEKETQIPFSLSEIKELEKGLPAEIRGRVEQLVPPVFMPRNEEEVMRNILILSKQLKFIRDIPQMIISFDEQNDSELSFTVVLVRILHADSLPTKELFASSKLAANVSIDRVKTVGMIRKKHPKEATVMRVRLPANPFLREDFSVDLFHARLQLVREIEGALGEVRDYNGGMISKQSENFALLKKELRVLAKKHALLLQNFFHSIFPVQLSTTCDPKLLKILFEMFLEAIDLPKEGIKTKKGNDCLFVLVKLQNLDLKQKILNQIEEGAFSSNEILSLQMQIFDSFYLGFIVLNSNKEKERFFFDLFYQELQTSTFSWIDSQALERKNKKRLFQLRQDLSRNIAL